MGAKKNIARRKIMSNPYLPKWEYIPDGEPRVFGDRVYVYGSHDRAGSDRFCDYVLKCYSAPLSDLNRWICHGDIFHTRVDRDHLSDRFDIIFLLAIFFLAPIDLC